MNFSSKTDSKKLEDLIAQAMKKVSASKENDICRYLPVAKGGYIHHFTMQKMKTEDPQGLVALINQNIIDISHPQKVKPKPRAPRGSRKRREHQHLSKQDIDRLLALARQANDKDMIRKLTPKKDLRTAKRELISSIKHNRCDEDLWLAYVELMTPQPAMTFGGNQAYASPFQNSGTH